MNSTWNLDPIYTGFDDPAFASDLEALKKTVSDMTDLTAALDTAEPTEGLRRCVALGEQSEKLVGKLANYASLRQAADTKSPEAGSAMGRIMGYAAVPDLHRARDLPGPDYQSFFYPESGIRR